MNRVAIDTECTGLNVWTGDRPFAVSACWGQDDRDTFYTEVAVNPKTRKPMWSKSDVAKVQRAVDRAGRKQFWNAKYDWLMLNSIGVQVSIPDVDEVVFMAKAVNNLEFSYELKQLSKKYLSIDDADQKDLHDAVVRCRRRAKKLGWSVGDEVEQDYWMPYTMSVLEPEIAKAIGVRGDECRTYGTLDAVRTFLLGGMYEVAMEDRKVEGIYAEEMQLWPVTLEIERHGVRIDPERMEIARRQCIATIDKYQAILDSSARRSKIGTDEGRFNINSPKQVAALLFEGPGALPVEKRTKTGQPKTDAEALAPYKQDPRVEAIFRVRSNTKGVRDFFEKYVRLATTDAKGQMILHPGCRQWGTLTSRYSMSDPNLQQVSDPDTSNSIAAEYMIDVRQVFIPRKGYVWYCPDFSQVEVIIFASVSGEPTMIDAILNGADIHGATAEKIWGGRDNPRAIIAAKELLGTSDDRKARDFMEQFSWSIGKAETSLGKKTFRKKAKSVTFTKVFGGGYKALMRWISVPKREAKMILHGYDETFPTIVRCMSEIEERGRKDGFVYGSYGQRLQVDPWKAYRAVNHIVQSDAARLMKRGMIKCDRFLKETGLDARILLTIHDELIFEFRNEHAFKSVLRRIKDLMSDHGGVFKVPTPVDMDKVSVRWSEKEKVKL